MNIYKMNDVEREDNIKECIEILKLHKTVIYKQLKSYQKCIKMYKQINRPNYHRNNQNTDC